MPIADPVARREYYRQWKRKHKNAGRCRCGRDVVPGRRRCGDCIEARARDTITRNERRRALGLCRHCGRTPEPGQSKCEPCREVGRASLRRIKARIISAYGGRCECCGETEHAFLTIDHINNDGARHRQEIKTTRLYVWLERHGYPKDGFRLLCFNCNCGRRVNGGICPHAANPTQHLSCLVAPL